MNYQCIRYTHMSENTSLNFIWRVPDDADEQQLVNKNSEVRDALLKQIPMYHTRAMHRDFVNSFGTVCNVESYVLREAYKRLKGDASAEDNVSGKEINTHLSEALDTCDPELIVDLCVDNQGRPEVYQVFLEECQKYISEKVETAVDDRRHAVSDNADIITRLATALSVRDLYEEVCKRQKGHQYHRR